MRVDTTKLGLDPQEAARRPFLASMGIYVFKYDRLERFLAEDQKWVDFGREIIPAGIESGHVQAHMKSLSFRTVAAIASTYPLRKLFSSLT